jgi:molybdenum cofactor biosynthesis enzyme MoaA
MDVGASNGWNMDEVIPSAEVVRRITPRCRWKPIGANYTGETAARWRYADGGGEIGMISSVTQAFCQDCSRARLSTEGKLYTCLFATRGHDLRALLREGRSDEEISTVSPSCGARAPTAIPNPHHQHRGLRRSAARKSKCPTSADNFVKDCKDHGTGIGRRARHAHGQRRQGPAAVRGSPWWPTCWSACARK